jgi:cytochrome c peroxidase
MKESNDEIHILSNELLRTLENNLESQSTNSIVPTLVRLAWHTAGTYQKLDNTGGSNGGYMRFSPECDWKANAGLKVARDYLEQFKAKYPNVSYADLWTLSGVVAIKAMGGPEIPWRRGRIDAESPPSRNSTVTEDRLPRADCGNHEANIQHIREIFERIGGLSEKEMVALIGAHAVGRCHTEASGYWGPWTNAETTFSNEYFRLLLEEKWTPKKTHNGKVRIPSISLSLPLPSCLFLALVTEMDWSCSI